MRWWPRSIRWQMLLGLIVLEALSIGFLALLLTHLQHRDLRDHVRHRLLYQTTSLALEAEEAFEGDRPDWARSSVTIAGGAPNVDRKSVV